MFELVGRPWESEDQRDWDPGAVDVQELTTG